LTTFRNNQILLYKISHRYLLTTNLFISGLYYKNILTIVSDDRQ